MLTSRFFRKKFRGRRALGDFIIDQYTENCEKSYLVDVKTDPRESRFFRKGLRLGSTRKGVGFSGKNSCAVGGSPATSLRHRNFFRTFLGL